MFSPDVDVKFEPIQGPRARFRISLTSRLPEIAAALEASTDAIAAHAAAEIAERAKEKVPVATGRLRDAIHVEQEGPGTFVVVAGDDEAFYGHMVEFGTSRTPPRPFLTPAVEEVAPEVTAELRSIFRGR